MEGGQFEEALSGDTALVSIMWANNETGVIFPIEKIAEKCAERRIPLHVDAVQVVGKLPVDLKRIPITFLALSGHKLHGPKGVGALYIRRGTKFHPFIIGGHQEKGRRGGTENVASIVGLGRACELAGENMEEERVEVASTAVDQARESHRITEARYEGGLANVTDLLRSQNALLEAEARYLSAVYAGRLAEARWELAVGTLHKESEAVKP